MRYQPRTDDYNFQNASITELPKCRKSLRQKLKPCTKLGIGEKFSNTHTLVNTHIQQAHGTCRFKESTTQQLPTLFALSLCLGSSSPRDPQSFLLQHLQLFVSPQWDLLCWSYLGLRDSFPHHLHAPPALFFSLALITIWHIGHFTHLSIICQSPHWN